MRFRKKPVEIDAEQWLPESPGAKNVELIPGCRIVIGPNGEKRVAIRTLEGTMLALPGDWIIRGVNGEYYPCKPDIFEKTYEAVE